MPRKGEIPKRRPAPDPKYGDVPLETRRRITKFINGVMLKGKKSVAEKIVYGAFEIIAHRLKDDPVKIFDKALANVRPRLEVRSRRVGGATYQVPVEVRPERAQALGMRWLIGYARARREDDAGEGRGRADGCRFRTGSGGEKEGGYAQDGRGQQGVRSLSLVGELLQAGPRAAPNQSGW